MAETVRDTLAVSIHAPARGATPIRPLRAWTRALFQSTLPRGERPTRPGHLDVRVLGFNPRSREGSDPGPIGADATTTAFQSTLPRGERPLVGLGEDGEPVVSIHAPARGATGDRRGALLELSKFQSTLPRGERLETQVELCTAYCVSIHAPARGATQPRPAAGGPAARVSIHAPARGATQLHHKGLGLGLSFNPRSREGSDHDIADILITSQPFQSTLPRGERPAKASGRRTRSQVSIHAPARGATSPSLFDCAFTVSFNPRSREGSDPLRHNRIAEQKQFQSTLPRGERRR